MRINLVKNIFTQIIITLAKFREIIRHGRKQLCKFYLQDKKHPYRFKRTFFVIERIRFSLTLF